MNNLKHLIFPLILLLTLNSYGQGSTPTGLLCELLPHPELSTITSKIPKFGWIVNSNVNGDYQTAYRIQVATSPRQLKNGRASLWDSDKISSNQSINVLYQGKELEPNHTYWWRVCNWDKSGKRSPWSNMQQFNTSDFDRSVSWPGESKRVEIQDSAGENFWTFEDREPNIYHKVTPKRVVHKEGSIFYDFGKDAFAYLTFNITWNPHHVNNDSLEISIGEKLSGDSLDENPGGSIVYENYHLTLKKGTHNYILKIPRFIPKWPHSLSMPVQMPEVIPFRYCEIKTLPDMGINNIAQEALYVLYDENASSFSSSDNQLNAIYDMCKYSTIANTFNGDYANSNRERMMYEADCHIQQMCHYSIDRKFGTARYSSQFLIYHATWPTEWNMQSVFMAWADYLYTGDTDVINKCYKDLKAKTLMKLEMPVGLISSRTGLQTKEFLKSIHYGGNKIADIVDWPDGQQGIYPYGETDGYEFKDYNTVVNSFYYRSLVLMGKMALAINRFEDYTLFKEKAENVYKVFNESFYDKRNKIYIDGIGSKHSSLHANMFPLAFGLVPEEYKGDVVNFVKDKWMACGVYGVFYLMQALYNAEQGAYALALLTNDSDRGWRNMIRVGATMTTEAWDQKYMPDYDSWNHAWSASPAYIIPHYLMGIQPVEAGFGKMIIKPQPGDLKWAKVKLPTIRGEVQVEFNQEPEQEFNLKISIPANTTAKVYLPRVSEENTLTVDGERVKNATTEGDWVVINSPSGNHSFKIKK